MSEKTEKATPYKLKKAKEQGQVAKSAELNAVISSLVLLMVLMALWRQDLSGLVFILKKLLTMAGGFYFSIANLQTLCHWVLSALVSLWLPLILALSITIILTNIGQTGFIWTAKPIVPDFNRLNPVTGFKRIYSMRLFFDLGKNVLKLTLVSIAIGLFLYWQLPAYIRCIESNPQSNTILLVQLVIKSLFTVISVLAVFALIDYWFTRWKYGRDNRMTKHEVQEEYKQREGNPKIKQKIRKLQQEMLQKINSLRQVKEADVIITNPTRLAIALKYDRGVMPAPRLLCKGRGEQAAQIRKIARRHQIPLIENKELAQALFKEVELNHWINPAQYAMAAAVYRTLYQQTEGAQG